MANAPVIKLRDYSVSTGVFEWEKDGKTSYSVSLQRSYKKKDAKEYTNETINLYPEDLLRVANLLINTYNALNSYANNNRTKDKPTPAAQNVVEDDIPF